MFVDADEPTGQIASLGAVGVDDGGDGVVAYRLADGKRSAATVPAVGGDWLDGAGDVVTGSS